eukprot:1086864-Prorocentrum_minimum.AAC.5
MTFKNGGLDAHSWRTLPQKERETTSSAQNVFLFSIYLIDDYRATRTTLALPIQFACCCSLSLPLPCRRAAKARQTGNFKLTVFTISDSLNVFITNLTTRSLYPVIRNLRVYFEGVCENKRVRGSGSPFRNGQPRLWCQSGLVHEFPSHRWWHGFLVEREWNSVILEERQETSSTGTVARMPTRGNARPVYDLYLREGIACIKGLAFVCTACQA